LRMGTRDFHSYFEGGLAGVRVWNRALAPAEIASLYATNRVPRQGLVAEYLLDEGYGTVADDGAGGHPRTIAGAPWRCEVGAVPCPPPRVAPFRRPLPSKLPDLRAVSPLDLRQEREDHSCRLSTGMRRTAA